MASKTIAIIGVIAVVIIAVAVALCCLPGDQDKPVQTNSTYYGNGGLTADGESSVVNNVSVTLDDIFIREGYSMSGWNTAKDGSGTSYGFHENTKGEKQFYAVWKQDAAQYSLSYSYKSAHDYTVVVEHDGKTEKLTKESNISCTNPKVKLTVSAPVSEMIYCIYNDNGRSMFKLNDGSYNTFFFTNVSSMTASASSNSITFDVTLTGITMMTDAKLPDGYAYLEGNGGTIGGVKHATEMIEGTEISKAPFKKSGYVLKGWNTKLDGSGQSYGTDITVKAGMILFAQWEKA